MKRKIGIFVVGLVIISMFLMPFSIKTSNAGEGQGEGEGQTSWTCHFTYSPNPGYYGEDITFTGTAGCSDPVNWTWTFWTGPTHEHRYGNPVTYQWSPNWQSPKSYQVSLSVTNSTGVSGGCFGFAQVIISYDLTGDCDAWPPLVSKGNPVTISIEAHNSGSHICPLGYKITVEIVTWIFEQHVAWPGNLTSEEILKGGATSDEDFTSVWEYPDQIGTFKAKVTFDPRFDSYLGNNEVTSYMFTVVR